MSKATDDQLPVDIDDSGAVPSARAVPEGHPWAPSALENWENHRTRTPPRIDEQPSSCADCGRSFAVYHWIGRWVCDRCRLASI